MDKTLERILSLIPRNENGDFKHGSRKQFAESIGLRSGNLIADWIAGRSSSYMNYLYEISDKYNVSVDWLQGTVSLDPDQQLQLAALITAELDKRGLAQADISSIAGADLVDRLNAGKVKSLPEDTLDALENALGLDLAPYIKKESADDGRFDELMDTIYDFTDAELASLLQYASFIRARRP